MKTIKTTAAGSTVLTSTALVLAMTLGSASGAAQADEEVTINQAFRSLLYLPLYVAQEKGFFADEGVSVNIETAGGGAQSWASVIGGSADFSIQDPVFVPKTREMGGDGVVVAGVQNAPTVFILGKDGTSLKDNLGYLSGKRVITSPEPDTTWAFMSYLLQQAHVDDVNLVNVSIGNEIPAIVAGQADYALAVDPQVTQGIQDSGLHAVYSFSDNSDWYPYAFSSLTTTRDYIDEHPQATQGVVTAFEKASRYIYSHTDDAVAVASKIFPDLPAKVIREAVQREIDAKGYPEHVLVSKTAWDNNMKVSVFAGTLKSYPSEATSYENNVDTSFAEKAQAGE